MDDLVERLFDCGSNAEGEFYCVECDGTGETEAEIDEPDGDYEYEARRDAKMDECND